jgi:hypothetical protein
VPRLRDPTGAYRLLLGSVLESIMIGDSVFRRVVHEVGGH